MNRIVLSCLFLALTTMTVSPNRRVIAVAERVNDRPHVTIYDLQSGKRRKTLQSELIKSNENATLCFRNDIATSRSKCIVALVYPYDIPLGRNSSTLK